ncbi:MAG: DNA polymerase III subunit beta [Planctomycetota bacterium]|nr:DNA polymerase III subunit beta [Planctomycetota bacterium]
MKLHCHRASLATAFQVVSGVVPSKTPKDILKNVKLQVDGTVATLIGTDLEVGIRYTIPGVEPDSSGETLLPTKRIMDILRELTADSVDLEIGPEKIVVRSGQSVFNLSAQDPAEFPVVADFGDDKYHVVAPKDLRAMIKRTVFATDSESTRYALGGVLLELTSDSITLAATDSRRLAMVRAGCRGESIDTPENAMPVVPSKAMTLVERSLEDDDDEVRIAVHANEILFKSKNSTIYSRLVEGRFPLYRDVIPQGDGAIVDLVVGPFYSAVRQAQIVTDEDSRGVDFTFENGTLRMNSQVSDVGQSTIELPISYDADPITITFDPRFVAEFLRVLDAESQVQLQLLDGESAAVFRTADDYTYVIMPLSRER